MSAASAVRPALSEAATRLHLGKRFARAGLTAMERAVLSLRLRGLTYRLAAQAVSRSSARVEQLERRAVAKLVAVADVPRRVSVAAVLQSGRAAYRLEPGLGVSRDDLHATDGPQVRKCAVPPSERRLEALADALLAEAERGPLSDERRRWYADEAARLAG
jgi:DNA-binding CsgD family transcriptional regulator